MEEKEKRCCLRMSEEIWEQIKRVAKQNKRSANKEIEFALEQYLRGIHAEEEKQQNK